MTLAEIKENDCLNFLGSMFGLVYNRIEENFEAFDKNGDGLVSKEEGVNAYLTFGLELDRSDIKNWFTKGKNVDSSFQHMRLNLYTGCGNSPLKFKATISNDQMDQLNSSFLNHKFVATKPLKIIAHGFKEDAFEFYSYFIKAYKKAGCNVNIICINWEDYSDSDPKVYKRPANNAIKIGKIVGEKIVKKVLIDRLGQDPKLIHAIGHSLGAHLVGNIAKNSGDQPIGRITGLDPANLLFEDNDAALYDKRLKKEDADLVDVIHTNSGDVGDGCFSILEPIGHVDFYPNGGIFMPGCQDTDPEGFFDKQKQGVINFHDKLFPFLAVKELMHGQCSHNMAQRYYQDSIVNKEKTNNFWSKKCDSYEDYEDNNCNEEGELPMGEALTKSDVETEGEGKYFLDTKKYNDDDEPYEYSLT